MTRIAANEAFVRHAQARLGVTVDGWAGPRTRAAFDAALPARKPAPAPKVYAAPVKPEAPAMYQGRARYEVREVVLHCAATRPDWMANQTIAAKVAEIRRWHVARGWRREGYHWMIDRDGQIMAGRPETEIGAHVREANRGTIGVCLFGGHGSSENDQFHDNFTRAQDRAVRDLIDRIESRARIQRISGHNEYAAKACPGFNVPRWLSAA